METMSAGGIGPEGQTFSGRTAPAELLTLLIENFGEKAYAFKPTKPVETLKELIEAKNLKQKDFSELPALSPRS
jgi:hypothetical protein